MINHEVKVYPSSRPLPKEEQLAYKIAALSADPVPLEERVAQVVIDRIIDNAGVALASLERRPVMVARAQAKAFPRQPGATLIGLPSEQTANAAWAGWANAVAVRELDFHDSFFGLESGHPGDSISPLLAVAQQMGRSGRDLARAIATAYEVQVDLCKGMALSPHRIDHIGHLAPAVAAGLGTLLELPVDVTYQAVQQAVHTAFATRQSRKGMLSSWKCYACAHAGKLAVEATDRAMRGESAPSPVYEGEFGVIATMLDGPDARYLVPLAAPGEPNLAILETYTKEHSAAYHGQAVIDLAFKIRPRISDTSAIERITIHSKHLTHRVTGSGANDPQKMDPNATRETLDHSVMFMFAVALQDGAWHHIASYTPERVNRPDTVELWQKIQTVEDDEWNRRYDDLPYLERAHGGRAEVVMKDGTTIVDEIHVANAHPAGASPFTRADYIRKFSSLVEGRIDDGELKRFLGLVERLPELDAKELRQLNPVADPRLTAKDPLLPPGIF